MYRHNYKAYTIEFVLIASQVRIDLIHCFVLLLESANLLMSTGVFSVVNTVLLLFNYKVANFPGGMESQGF